MLAGNSAGTLEPARAEGERKTCHRSIKRNLEVIRMMRRFRTFEKPVRGGKNWVPIRGLFAAKKSNSWSGDSRCGGGPVVTSTSRLLVPGLSNLALVTCGC